MRLLLFLLFGCCGTVVCAQDLTDTLSKYCYQVQINRHCQSPKATGFFVRYEKRLFLVSCGRLSGVFKRSSDNTKTDTLFLRSVGDTSLLPLPLAELSYSVKRNKEQLGSDLLVMEITKPKKYSVFSVEDFFGEEIPCEEASKVILTGFTVRAQDENNAETPLHSLFLNTSLNETYCVYSYLPELKAYDQTHYYPAFEQDMRKMELSGAPAFLLTKDDGVVFGGVYLGVRSGTNRGMIIRPEYVIGLLIDYIVYK
ncbi:MAG: hypothetical protein EON98_08770 [Chitinophagaceae bacterium]|nr:MAG: hypothetical protein EON98_08770 [Chitinophagaceae bacterium]